LKCEWTGDDVVLEKKTPIALGTTVLEPHVVLLEGSASLAARYTVDCYFVVTKLEKRDLAERKAFFLEVFQQRLFDMIWNRREACWIACFLFLRHWNCEKKMLWKSRKLIQFHE
jgi:hypothetical protein